MTKKLLIATLGTVPAVITEAIDLLREQHIDIEGVLLLKTMDYDVRRSFALLADHLHAHYGMTMIMPADTGVYDDIDSTDAGVAFMVLACQQLKIFRDARYKCYVCLAGGRKVMSTSLALAAQFYGAERLFHVWVPATMDGEGEIDELEKLAGHSELQLARLHPPLDRPHDERPQLVDLPLIGLFPLMPDILAAMQGQPASPQVKALLSNNGLLDTDGLPTHLGEQVAKILKDVESLPSPSPKMGEVQLNRNEPKWYRFLEAEAKKLLGAFPFIVRIRNAPWREGQNKVVAHEPGTLYVFLRPHGESFCLSLELETTAQTSGQLEAARKAVERYMSR